VPTGTLFLVSTPIGNLEDVTLRALRVLAEADRLYAEDTRRTRILLDRHGIAKRPQSLHAHNEAGRLGDVLEVLAGGGSVALVSDAGTPGISDPGERVAHAAAEAGHRVEAVPGASAVLAALVSSALPTAPFTFVGFLPRRKGERARLLEQLSERPETLVLFESPRRLPMLLGELCSSFGAARQASVARELSKRHESVERGTLAELAQRFADAPRGEVTLVVAGAPPRAVDVAELDDAIRVALRAGSSPRTIAATLAAEWNVSRRSVYSRALALREEP
jgi:16S rRNA (cytidine1402-2'-O)-methyltransferase